MSGSPARSEGWVIESVRSLPATPLRGLISAYDGYRQRGVPPARHLGLPSPFLTMIVTLDEPLQIVRHLDRTRPAERYDALIGGLHTAPVVIGHQGAQCRWRGSRGRSASASAISPTASGVRSD